MNTGVRSTTESDVDPGSSRPRRVVVNLVVALTVLVVTVLVVTVLVVTVLAVSQGRR